MSKQELPMFKRRIKMLYAESGLGAYVFARHIGTTYDTFRRWCLGKRIPGAISLYNVCKACNVSADWLLGLSDRR